MTIDKDTVILVFGFTVILPAIIVAVGMLFGFGLLLAGWIVS